MRYWLLRIGLICLPIVAVASARLTDYSVQKKSNSTYIALHTSKETAHKVFTLSNPSRIVIDLSNTKASSHLKHSRSSRSIVKNVRLGTKNKKNLRLVFDLKKSNTPIKLVDTSLPHSPYIHLSITQQKPKQLSRIEQAAQPMWLTPVSPSSKSKPSTTTPHQSPERFIIIIDPGHGGKDPGATGARGHHEKYIVLAIAKRLQRMLNKEPYYKAILTRHGDYYLTLRQRLQFARSHHANLFISIHADAFRRHAAHGASVYALSERGASSEAAHWLASKENDSELLGGVNLENKTDLLKSVLIDLSQSASVRESMDLGKTLLRELDNVTKLHHRRVEEAAFVVLKSPDIPSLLIETGFLSNPSEERKLVQAGYQTRLAGAIRHGIDSYMDKQRAKGRQIHHY